jgi:hypothetical protein
MLALRVTAAAPHVALVWDLVSPAGAKIEKNGSATSSNGGSGGYGGYGP